MNTEEQNQQNPQLKVIPPLRFQIIHKFQEQLCKTETTKIKPQILYSSQRSFYSLDKPNHPSPPRHLQTRKHYLHQSYPFQRCNS